MSKMVRILSIDLFIVLAFIIAIIMFVLPQKKKLEQEYFEMNKINQNIIELESWVSDVDELGNKMQEVELKAEMYHHKFCPEEELPLLMKSLSDLIEQNNLKVLSILPKGISDTSDTSVLKKLMQIELKGSYHNLGIFLEKIEGHPHAMMIDSLEMERMNEESALLNIRLTLALYLKRIGTH